MIRPLRQRHRHTVIALGIFLPVAFAVGIAVRRPVPSMAALPDTLLIAPVKFPLTAWERADLFEKSPVRVRLQREATNTGGFAVELSAGRNFTKPDLIVYWVAGDPIITVTLPGDAILLGSFSAGPLPLPDEAVKSNGRFALFSLADNEIVDVSKPIEIPKP